MYTALAIEKFLPIMHCGPGCYANVSCTLGTMNGGQSPETYNNSIVPSTNFCEDDVVFGGVDRLHALVGECIKYYDSDLYLIIDGCTAEIVGDDLEEVANAFQSEEKPIIYTSLPGFKGNSVWGHGEVLASIVDQYMKPAADIDPLQVNIFGIVPYFDPHWSATLDRLEELLIYLGLKPNIIYGRNRGKKNIDKIPAAGFNLVLAPWTDLALAEKLKEKFGTPYLHFDNQPIGPTETAKFIRRICKYANLGELKAETYIKKEEDRYYYYLRRSYPWIYSCKNFPREFVVNASAAAAVSVSRFAVNDLGMIPKRIYVTDGIPEEYQPGVEAMLRDVEYDGDFEVIFTEDGGLFEDSLKYEDLTIRKLCVFGSSWELVPTTKEKLPFVPVTTPLGDFMLGSKTYFGYEGGLTFMADLYSDAANKVIDVQI
jgi:nitrogenase molybdenum-iron protein beta chain